MEPRLLFWTAALANMGLIVACGVRGVRAIRRRDARTHRAMMLTCAALVALFLAAYLAKVALLGREERRTWTALENAILYGHESCVAVMLGAGLAALVCALRFPRPLTSTPPPEGATLPGRRFHRRAGSTAARAALLALASAAAVWGVLLAESG